MLLEYHFIFSKYLCIYMYIYSNRVVARFRLNNSFNWTEQGCVCVCVAPCVALSTLEDLLWRRRESHHTPSWTESIAQGCRNFCAGQTFSLIIFFTDEKYTTTKNNPLGKLIKIRIKSYQLLYIINLFISYYFKRKDVFVKIKIIISRRF